MMSKKSMHGFIMITTLMIIALAVILVNYMFYKGTAFLPISKTYIERERTLQLVEGGIQLAMSQLAYAGAQESEKDVGATKQPAQSQGTIGQQGDPVSRDKKILESLLPVLNRWQEFAFEEARDGINGTLYLYIASDDGKININEIYDFKKHTFVGSTKAEQDELKSVLQSIFAKIKTGAAGSSHLFEAFEKFLKARQYKLQDVTELLTVKEFGELFKERMFIELPMQKQKKDEASKELYFTDIFTIWSSGKLDMTLLSQSVGRLFGLEWPWTKKEKVASLLKNFNPKYKWPDSWKPFFGEIYKKEFNALPKGIGRLLADSFDPKFFSVMAYAQVGEMKQGLFAIIERESSKDEKQPATVILKKMYWN